MEKTGWSKATTRKVFARDDFPAQKFGKSYQVEVSALKEFFKTRHVIEEKNILNKSYKRRCTKGKLN